ncbi:ATP-binding protein [Kitasatospora sp. NBC_00240]|uniref:ATP-binding protein n=1 Tax=Kitasatospora sp. NBC_00240 TaxID=2903567 RepID=UPI0022564223|nr:ATP-binding protein [Kitasatospora sp. NBC_00240]MCX5216036.1 ATP-binding protein [Kitasatospora sp. NBC_00240]
MEAVATLPVRSVADTASHAGGITPDPGAADGPAGGRRGAVWELAHHPASAGAARRITRAALRAWSCDEEITDQALLVVSELVSNAIEHALPPIALRLGRPTPGDTLHIAVDDGGPAAQEGTWTASCAPEEHGRGRAIIAGLATAHGCHPSDHGTTYWADL